MKKVVITLVAIVISLPALSTKLVKEQGSTVDIFTDLPVKSICEADTIIITGGTGSITLRAGSADDGAPYRWDLGSTGETTYEVAFTYTHATQALPNGAKGALIAAHRSNPLKSQYVWIIYNNLPLKPSKPAGDTQVCSTTSTSYTALSVNANSYAWELIPVEAGTLSNQTTSNVTVTWASGWVGTASLTSKGINGTDESPSSDPLQIEVISVPNKPTITGSSIVEKETTSVYFANAQNAATWEWVISPSGMASSSPTSNQTTVSFTDSTTLTITAQASNSCGLGLASDNMTVRVIDSFGMMQDIKSLTSSNEALALQVENLIADSTSKGAEYRSIIDELQTQNNALDDLNFSLLDSIAGLNTTVDELDIQNKELLTLNTGLESQIFSLEDEKLALEGIIDDLKLENTDLQNQVNELLATITTLETTIDDRDATIYELEAAVAELEAQVAALELWGSELELENSNMNSTLAELTATVAELTASVESLQALNDDLFATNTTLQTTINELRASNKSLTDEVADLTQQVQTLSQVYILSWSVQDVTTHTFNTAIGNFSISLYPNPSPGEVFISCTEPIKTLKLFNLSGQMILQQEVNGLNTSFIANRGSMPPGTYLVQIETSKGKSTHRIVFQ